jgi:hypothetical protein
MAGCCAASNGWISGLTCSRSGEVVTRPVRWDDSTMSDYFPDHGPHLHAPAAPTTQQMRTVGQRRREAEEKLEQHLQEARLKDQSAHDEAVTLAATPAADENDGGLAASEGVDPNPGR